MTIQFSQQEITDMRHYLNNIALGETQKQLRGLGPEWNRLFLLLRKLLAYGAHHVAQTDPAMSYPDLQKKSQKPNDMLVTVHAYFSHFDQLLATYTANHPDERTA